MNFASQNNPLWKNDKIGKSNLSLSLFGCTTSCISDASSYFGEEKTPKEIAKMNLYTPAGLVLWGNIGKCFKTFEFEWRGYNYNKAKIDEALNNPDKVVMVNVAKGAHWVFIVGARLPVFGYRVSDPFPFPAKATMRKDIVGYAILKRK